MFGFSKKWMWFFSLVVLAAAGAAVAWWLMRLLEEQEEEAQAVRMVPQRSADVNIPLPELPIEPVSTLPAAPEAQAAPEPPAEQSPVADDLKRIDGIGPKTAQGLAALGITTFAALAAQDPADLEARLEAAGVRVVGDSINNKDWIGQAKRLAAGEE